MLRSLLRPARLAAKRSFSYASVNGVAAPAASLNCSIWDVTFQRGDGVFEAVRIVPDRDGNPIPRCAGLHLDRLARSAAALELPLPPRDDALAWLAEAAKEGGHGGYVRLMVTRGGGSPGSDPRGNVELLCTRVAATPTAATRRFCARESRRRRGCDVDIQWRSIARSGPKFRQSFDGTFRTTPAPRRAP